MIIYNYFNYSTNTRLTYRMMDYQYIDLTCHANRNWYWHIVVDNELYDYKVSSRV